MVGTPYDVVWGSPEWHALTKCHRRHCLSVQESRLTKRETLLCCRHPHSSLCRRYRESSSSTRRSSYPRRGASSRLSHPSYPRGLHRVHLAPPCKHRSSYCAAAAQHCRRHLDCTGWSQSRDHLQYHCFLHSHPRSCHPHSYTVCVQCEFCYRCLCSETVQSLPHLFRSVHLWMVA